MLLQDSSSQHVASVGQFLNQPSHHRLAEFLTWAGLMHLHLHLAWSDGSRQAQSRLETLQSVLPVGPGALIATCIHIVCVTFFLSKAAFLVTRADQGLKLSWAAKFQGVANCAAIVKFCRPGIHAYG